MVNIRSANKDDVKALQVLNDHVFIDNQKYDADLDMGWAQSDKGKTYFTELFNNSKSCCFIAEENGRKIGYIAAKPKYVSYRKSRYLEIENMGVIPEFRSKGIGTMLISKCLNWAKAHGFQKAFVNAYFQNKRALDFYKRSGFLEIDVSLERNL